MTLRICAKAAVILSATILFLARCGSFPERGSPTETHAVKILTDAFSIRSEKGEFIAGYIAETTTEPEPSRMFVSMKLQRYEKNERLSVTGRFLGDKVRVELDVQPAADYQVFVVTRAEPEAPKRE